MKNALIFVDTNIFLDFYRIRGDDGGLSLLNHLQKVKDRLITGSQVEMEYKKNRQRVVVESLKHLKSPDWGVVSPPAFLTSAQSSKMIAKEKKKIEEQCNRLKTKIEAVLKNPTKNDPVFKSLQSIFKHKGPFNLARHNKVRFEIRELAKKRFFLGYPPKKEGITSLGDSINWEWIIACAKSSKRDVIIVSRDGDYGATYEKELILNDWLTQEFRERMKRRGASVVLTDQLTKAFRMAAIQVSRQEEQQEQQLVSEIREDQLRNLPDRLTSETTETPQSTSTLSRLLELAQEFERKSQDRGKIPYGTDTNPVKDIDALRAEKTDEEKPKQ